MTVIFGIIFILLLVIFLVKKTFNAGKSKEKLDSIDLTWKNLNEIKKREQKRKFDDISVVDDRMRDFIKKSD